MSETKYPPLQLVNENDEPIGGASLQEAYTKSLPHRIVFVVVRDPNGKILLQRRSLEVATNAGLWDISAAGHVEEGDTYQTAAGKELFEELGIHNVELTEVDYYRELLSLDGYKLDRFIKIFKAIVPDGIQLKLNPEEVTEARWFGLDELKNLFDQQPGDFIKNFNKLLARIRDK